MPFAIPKRNFAIMSMPKSIKAALAAMLLVTVSAPSQAQERKTCKNQYPCGDCAVHDNNGNDLAGFTRSYKKQFHANGDKVVSASNGDWGYVLMRTAVVPSVSSRWETKGELNYSLPIRSALAMVKAKENNVATWWARECNMDNGPVTQVKSASAGNEEVELPMKRYDNVFRDLDGKKMTLVEYLDTFNIRDFDYMCHKNHIVSKCGTIKPEDFKPVVDYFNNFLSKFSYTDDPVITRMSFITFFAGSGNAKYIGYFNVVNDKLSGYLEPLVIEYERDKDTIANHAFARLATRTVYIYGDDSFGMDKAMIRYAKANEYKLRRRTAKANTRFNDEQ